MAKKIDISVMTSVVEAPPENGVKEIINVVEWNSFKLFSSLKKIEEISPSAIIYQYVPFMYGRAGINFIFPLMLLYLRFIKGRKVYGMFHELGYPLQLNPKSMVMFFSHSLILILLMFATDGVFVSIEGYRKRLKRLFFWKKIENLFIASTIERDQQATRKVNNGKAVVLATVGGFHPTKRLDEMVRLMIRLNTEEKIPVELRMIGVSKIVLCQQLAQEDHKYIDDFLIPMGHLQEREVSQTIFDVDFVLAYFTDGMTARRSSAIVALQHGVPLISSFSSYTELHFKDVDGIYLYDLDLQIFYNQLKDLLHGYQRDGLLREDRVGLVKLYQEKHSWQQISKRMMKTIC